jgi:hypothetical protein
MDSLKNLETMVASWYKGVPHLPKTGQKWLAENAWCYFWSDRRC